MSKWFQAQRQMWIGNKLLRDGRVNRTDIMEYFDVSAAQASVDLRTFRDNNPKAMIYCPYRKSYVIQETA